MLRSNPHVAMIVARRRFFIAIGVPLVILGMSKFGLLHIRSLGVSILICASASQVC